MVESSVKIDDGADKGIDLTVIVPVYNAAQHLETLIGQFLALDLNCQILLVDDGSTDGSRDEIARLAQIFPQVTGLYQDGNLGAGHARNFAWPHAQGRYTIFFDADDRLHGEVVLPAINLMDASADIDVAIFAYRYEREESASFTAMAYTDQQSFEQLLKGARTTVGPLTQMARLLQFTNYPWNKIVRTAHYKQVGLRYGSTRVNNDILGHWSTLLFARQILVVDEVICTHIVHPQGQNLTNSFSVERLQMFDALTETYDLLESHPALRWRFAHHFWMLTSTLMLWTRPRLPEELRPVFENRYRDLLGRLHLEDYARMRTQHVPELANRFAKDLIG